MIFFLNIEVLNNFCIEFLWFLQVDGNLKWVFYGGYKEFVRT